MYKNAQKKPTGYADTYRLQSPHKTNAENAQTGRHIDNNDKPANNRQETHAKHVNTNPANHTYIKKNTKHRQRTEHLTGPKHTQRQGNRD